MGSSIRIAGIRVLAGVTLLALLVFGAVKARFTGVPMLRGALQTAVVGGVAAIAGGVLTLRWANRVSQPAALPPH
jgi:VIT1/CCC1 family predicted Fe2+/Mn2+ transporter